LIEFSQVNNKKLNWLIRSFVNLPGHIPKNARAAYAASKTLGNDKEFNFHQRLHMSEWLSVTAVAQREANAP